MSETLGWNRVIVSHPDRSFDPVGVRMFLNILKGVNDMFKVSFPEKNLEFEAPLSVFDAARAGELVTRAHIAAEVDGAVVGMTHTLAGDSEVKLLTFADAASSRPRQRRRQDR